MAGVEELTDEIVVAAVEGASSARAQVLEFVGSRVRLMVAARLSPTPGQFDAVDDIAQEVLVGLATGLANLTHRTVGGLNAYVSGIVSRQVASKIGPRGGAAAPGGHVASLDSTIATLSGGGPLWQLLSAGGTSPRTAAERAEQVRRLMIALGQLKPEHREIITLVVFDEFKMRDAARQMDISRPAAAMLFKRAVHALGRQMAGTSTIGHIGE